MADFIPVAAFNMHNFPTAQRPLQHLRTESYSHSKAPPSNSTRPVSRSISSSEPRTTKQESASSRKFSLSYEEEDGNMSTIPDPRSQTISPAKDSSPATPLQHPDLSDEVATLSNKLINAINQQTSLDDTLSATRHELETSRERCRQSEEQIQTHMNLVARGILVRRSVTDAETNKLMLQLAQEKKLRLDVEKSKKEIEQELETLTISLFEEANKMVITAREEAQKEHDIVTKKNDQLKSQIGDMESLLKSQQEQLMELKQVMEQMTVERDDQTNATAPSTPGLSKFDSKDDEAEQFALHNTTASVPVTPSYPTSFTHLLVPVLRTDLGAFDEFTSLLKMSKNIAGSRASSGSYGSIGLGLGLGGYAGSVPANNSSSASLATSGTAGSAPVTPTTPASITSTGSINAPKSLTPLKETKFYKRALAEDIEPTLRLETAPGLSWLARRTVQTAIYEGTLVVDPMPATRETHTSPCSLCGENRKDPLHVRSHRFRTSESESAQRYALCKYCLGRIRSTCDFLGFLRILKEGHWRARDEDDERAAWEESVRLREQMFWARLGGGVIPTANCGDALKSPRVSEDVRKEQENELSEELERTGELVPKDVTHVSAPTPAEVTEGTKPSPLDSTAADGQKAKLVSEEETSMEAGTSETPTAVSLNTESLPPAELTNKRASSRSLAPTKATSPTENDAQRLSITIPGSFD
ncbi:hypothetical protein BJ878DRAFT_477444 [Calycina marina]|uniref:GDP/GTP exchange factor Sec2 N-terminal domain-containing protein n=1 Tax=Calycina marina TaxID=1763456 RepID=A0A9P7Z8V2_9HELO|nr:hypothetical protein BJ878DRAFT_477444 [Calycina marina]